MDEEGERDAAVEKAVVDKVNARVSDENPVNTDAVEAEVECGGVDWNCEFCDTDNNAGQSLNEQMSTHWRYMMCTCAVCSYRTCKGYNAGRETHQWQTACYGEMVPMPQM